MWAGDLEENADSHWFQCPVDSCPWGCCQAAALAVVTNDPRTSLFNICLFIKLRLLQWILCIGAQVQGTELWMGARHKSPSPPGAGWKYFRGSWIFPDCFTGADVLCCCECGGVAVPYGCRGAGQLESPSKEGIEQGGEWRNGYNVFKHATCEQPLFTSALGLWGLY